MEQVRPPPSVAVGASSIQGAAYTEIVEKSKIELLHTTYKKKEKGKEIGNRRIVRHKYLFGTVFVELEAVIFVIIKVHLKWKKKSAFPFRVLVFIF